MHVHMHRETYELTKAIVVLSEIVAWWAGAVEASHGVDTLGQTRAVVGHQFTLILIFDLYMWLHGHEDMHVHTVYT